MHWICFVFSLHSLVTTVITIASNRFHSDSERSWDKSGFVWVCLGLHRFFFSWFSCKSLNAHCLFCGGNLPQILGGRKYYDHASLDKDKGETCNINTILLLEHDKHADNLLISSTPPKNEVNHLRVHPLCGDRSRAQYQGQHQAVGRMPRKILQSIAEKNVCQLCWPAADLGVCFLSALQM